MRILEKPKTAGNDLEVWMCRWQHPTKPNKKLGSLLTPSRERAERIYTEKDAAGLEPVLESRWIGGFIC